MLRRPTAAADSRSCDMDMTQGGTHSSRHAALESMACLIAIVICLFVTFNVETQRSVSRIYVLPDLLPDFLPDFLADSLPYILPEFTPI